MGGVLHDSHQLDQEPVEFRPGSTKYCSFATYGLRYVQLAVGLMNMGLDLRSSGLPGCKLDVGSKAFGPPRVQSMVLDRELSGLPRGKVQSAMDRIAGFQASPKATVCLSRARVWQPKTGTGHLRWKSNGNGTGLRARTEMATVARGQNGLVGQHGVEPVDQRHSEATTRSRRM